MSPIPTISDVEAAAERLSDYAIQTPVLESERVNDQLGCRLLIKAENLQRTGSFKFRGAFNMISGLAEEERSNGVVAFSSGNHAQGVAAAAKILGIKASIVMPADAPQIKIDNTRGDGADVVLYNRTDGNRVAIAEEIIAKTGAILIPPYNAHEIMVGQGTLGLEFFQQNKEMGASLDYLLGPCSGGGMIGGSAIVFSDRSPATEVYAVEPVGYDDTTLSLAKGERVQIKPGTPSFCDALLLETPGEITFAVNKELLAGGLVVSQAETAEAMKTAFQEYKIVVEPGGAVALAAALSGKIKVRGSKIGVICTGGNVDAATFKDVLDGKYD
ncbi:MAG: threonine/serine dehydratase [Rhodospirillaceae bacterium]|mgnify:CR=1 FL=1|nr:threonine/serine dehydratase [Rhodospirillaceae bacterium]MBT7956083.1 threonine/serine dehydratase [Rhodospirillaceae bacterium]